MVTKSRSKINTRKNNKIELKILFLCGSNSIGRYQLLILSSIPSVFNKPKEKYEIVLFPLPWQINNRFFNLLA